MRTRTSKTDLARLLASKCNSDEETANAWIDAFAEVIYQEIKAGRSITIPGLGGFYVRPERSTWVFKFNPGQKLRAVLGWSSKYKGAL